LFAASRRAGKLSDEERARMKPWVAAAQARFGVARELRDPETQNVALALLEQASFFALCALQADSTSESLEVLASSPKEAWQSVEARADLPPGAVEQLGFVLAAFSSDNPLSVERMPPQQANELRLAAETSVAWLLTLAEVRSPSELYRARFVRSALALLGLVLIAWGLIAYWLSLTALEPR
jgi:hypothetical protein